MDKLEECRLAFKRLDSWNGKHLVSPRDYGFPMNFMCSEKVKQLAEERGWSNVDFVEVSVR